MWSRVVLFLTLTAGICAAQERLVPIATPKRPANPPPPPAFIIGVYMQPPDMFDTWRIRGINTLIGYESRGRTITNQAWSDAAAIKGFYYFRHPADDLEADAKDPNLLAWMHDDEPDVRKPPTDPARLQEAYDEWKKAAPKMPVFVNFSGGNVLGGKTPKETYLGYIKAADWLGNDFYAVTGYNRPDWLWKIGAAVDTLRDWSGGKPQLAFIESSPQRLSWTPKTTRGVTPDELRAEIWHSVIHGARGIVYFPQQIGEGFKFDATPQRVVMEMVKQNKRLTEIGAALSAEMNPTEKGAKPHASAPAPLEVGWRLHESKLYIIALNFSDQELKNQTISLRNSLGEMAVLWESRFIDAKGGAITDNFAPYEVHIYAQTPK